MSPAFSASPRFALARFSARCGLSVQSGLGLSGCLPHDYLKLFIATKNKSITFVSSDDMMNKLIQKRSLAEEVAELVRTEINSGQYQHGQQLPTEPELMKQFGVGRSSVREAVRILANSGLLNVQQGVGTFICVQSGITEPFVQRLKRSKSNDLDEVRQLLEMKVAQKAALNHTDADLKQIKGFLDQRKAAADAGLIEDCIRADINFHMSIAKASGNDILSDLYQSFAEHLKNWFTQTYTNTEIFKETWILHHNLYVSIKAGDSKKAWDAAAKIVNN